MADWGYLVKIEDSLAVKDVDSSATPISAVTSSTTTKIDIDRKSLTAVASEGNIGGIS